MTFGQRLLALAVIGAASIGAAQPGPAGGAGDDPHIWLEQVQDERALDWVRVENERTLAAFRDGPRFQQMQAQALEMLQARDRIPFVQMRADGLYSFWQDQDHVRGIVRRTSLASFRTDDPQWETMIDIDALARAENANWVYRGMICLRPAERFCLVRLSNGGRDTEVIREYDLVARRFVAGGFDLPEAKQYVEWLDPDTLLVARDWGEGSLTASGHPFILKRLRRGQPLAEAEEMFRGSRGNMMVQPFVVRDRDGAVRAAGARNYITLFDRETILFTDAGPVRLALPGMARVQGIVDGRVIVSLDLPWAPAPGLSFAGDSLISYDLAAWTRDPLGARPDLIWAPGDRQTVSDINLTGDQLLLTILDNVRSRAIAFDYDAGAWRGRPLATPPNAAVDVATTSPGGGQAMLSVAGFLTPATLWLHDGASGELARVKAAPPRFDSSRHVVEQLETTSRDGTRIPYFLVRPRDLPRDGSTPTILYGYGGFQVPLEPSYSGITGRLWLEQGNAYVVANVRGGGELGPGWHQAGRGANKQRAYDDFIAVAEDLVRRRITSPRRLGAMGESGGGLLVGAVITQRPDLFNAAVLQVPLFDMLRYHEIGAGASWIVEYGDPRVPAQRAWLEAYSPYHRMRRGQAYPAPLITTSTADDRVTPVHGRKAAARFAEFGQPYFYYENINGGHAGAANLSELARLEALTYAYLTRRLVD